MHRIISYLKAVLDFVLPEKQVLKSVRNLSLDRLGELMRPHIVERGFVALFNYRDKEIKSAIWTLKYYKEDKSAELFGNILYSYLLDELSDRAIFNNVHSPLFIPIPLSKQKLIERGFNQSEKVVRACIAYDNEKTLELCVAAFERVRDTRAQAKMSDKLMRKANIKGAFRVTDREVVSGRDIVLFDDVITTGATMSEAKDTLMNAGAKSVFCVAIAH